MRFINGKVFTPDGAFHQGGFSVKNHVFTDVFSEYAPEGAEETADLGGAYVIPGLFDIHIHGAVGADVTDGDAAGLRKMARHLFSKGVTSFLPTTVTAPIPVLKTAIGAVRTVRESGDPLESEILGIHLEGPYFSEKKKGAQNGAYLKKPDAAEFRSLQACAGGLIRLSDAAPELPGAIEFIREIAEETVVSVAHTDCTYEEAKRAFEAGASHLTHTFNAMPELLHRAPGPVAAASECENVYAELISDGIHVDPAMVRIAFRLFPGRICLISDALRAEGLSDGSYDLGGLKVHLSGRRATLESGTIAGSVTNLFDAMRMAVSFGVSREEAILAATLNPAKALHLEERLGSISPGRKADFLLLDEDLNLIRVTRA